MSSLNGRLKQAEKKAKGPARIIVLWPGDELPEETVVDENLTVIRVIYTKDWRADGQPDTYPEDSPPT